MKIDLKKPWNRGSIPESFYNIYGSMRVNLLTIPVWVFRDLLKKVISDIGK